MSETWEPHMLPGPVYSWESQAGQYAPSGLPGIGYERHYADGFDIGPEAPVDCLLMRDVHGQLVGILNHYPETDPGGLEQAGNVNLWVRPDRRRRGIGSMLMRAAQERWPIRFEQQRYTRDGIAFVTALRRTQTSAESRAQEGGTHE
jgi:GNAT superfamily N-acetyltransferase